MDKRTIDILKTHAKADSNYAVLVQRILKGAPLQGGKPIIIK